MLHLLVLIFACANSVIHAADNPEPGFLTFETNQISAANPAHPAPRVLNTIDFAQEESHTKKTFGELFRNAQEKNVPWAVLSLVMQDPANEVVNFTIDQFDLIELVRVHGYHNMHNCRSTQAVTKTINESLKKYIRSLSLQALRTTYNICTFVPQNSKFIPVSDVSVAINAVPREVSHIGALLGIALYKDNVNAALFLRTLKHRIATNDFKGDSAAEKETVKSACTVIEQFWDAYFAAMTSEQTKDIEQGVDTYLQIFENPKTYYIPEFSC